MAIKDLYFVQCCQLCYCTEFVFWSWKASLIRPNVLWLALKTWDGFFCLWFVSLGNTAVMRDSEIPWQADLFVCQRSLHAHTVMFPHSNEWLSTAGKIIDSGDDKSACKTTCSRSYRFIQISQEYVWMCAVHVSLCFLKDF